MPLPAAISYYLYVVRRIGRGKWKYFFLVPVDCGKHTAQGENNELLYLNQSVLLHNNLPHP
jgi:hypothetical protein